MLSNPLPGNEISPLQALAWQVEMGADEALGDIPGLVHWPAPHQAAKPGDQPQRATPSPPKFQEAPSSATQTIAKVIPFAPPAAPADLSRIQTVEQLEQAVRDFTGCALKNTALNTVFADGTPTSRVMFIGEAPGEDEDRQGKPFVGVSGQLLNKMLAGIHVKREDVYITNIVFWRPPGNRTPADHEISACLPFTLKHIEILKPKIIVPLGGIAVKSILNTKDGITKIRGRKFTWSYADGSAAHVLPFFHPAYLLRQQSAKRQAWADMQMLRELLD